MTIDSSSDIMDIISKIKKAKIGDVKRIDFLEKVVSLSKPLKSEDEEYLIRLLYQLESGTVESAEDLPKIEIEEFKKVLNAYKKHYSEKAKNTINESKFKLSGSKTCERCSTRLGFKKFTPEKNWGIQNYLCKSCYEFIKLHVVNYSGLIKKSVDIISPKKHGVISVQNFDVSKRVVFGNKEEPILLSIPVEFILKHEIVDYEEESTKKKILTLGFKKTITNPHFSIIYKFPSQLERNIIFHSKDLAKISTSVGNLVLEYRSELLKSKDKDFETYKTT